MVGSLESACDHSFERIRISFVQGARQRLSVHTIGSTSTTRVPGSSEAISGARSASALVASSRSTPSRQSHTPKSVSSPVSVA